MKKIKTNQFKPIKLGDIDCIALYTQEGKYISTIDIEDLNKVQEYYWGISDSGYVVNIARRQFMHNLIMGVKKHSFNAEVDHINRDKKDNRKCNLRVVSRQINNLNIGMQKNNTSGYKGVAWHNQRQKWRAYIMLDYRQIHLGLFDTPEEAYKVRLEYENNLLNDLLDKYNEDSK